VRLEAGEDMAAVGGEHPVAVALQPERGGAGGAYHAVGFKAHVGGCELGVGLLGEEEGEGYEDREANCAKASLAKVEALEKLRDKVVAIFFSGVDMGTYLSMSVMAGANGFPDWFWGR
jgi:hypothetical protein